MRVWQTAVHVSAGFKPALFLCSKAACFYYFPYEVVRCNRRKVGKFMARGSEVFGQTNLFDLFDDFSVVCSATNVQSVQKEPEPENYLMRGERILSLLRERMCKEFKKSSFLELFSMKRWENSGDRGSYVISRIKNGLIRPIIESYTDWNDELESNFRSLFCGYDANLDFVESDSYHSKVYQGVTVSESWSVLLRTDTDEYLTLGKERLSARKQHRSWRPRYGGEWVRMNDFGDYFAGMVGICQIKAYLTNYFSGMSTEELEGNVVYRRLVELAEAERKKLANLGKLSNGTITIEDRMKKSAFICKLLTDIGLQSRETSTDILAQLNFSNVLANFLLSDEVTGEDLTLSKWKTAISVCGSDLAGVIDILLDDYSEEKQTQEYRRGLSESYARSFMTKKNIPEKMLKAMETSGFNNTFGYVEFDEECDIEKLDAIYKEFEVLADYMRLGKHEMVSLRFRKLGNHKATGLYYPVLKCLCVDVRCPSSFSHEIFHMLDYEKGEVSRSWEFQNIKDLYKKEFNRIAKEKKITLKGKYDQDYYFQATEIFARSGEMYLTRICGINNSLVAPGIGSVEYPWTPELAEAVKAYFDVFLGLETGKYEFAA